jgi:hypothetical protein
MRAHFQKFRLGRVPVWLRKRILEKFGRAASDVPLGLRFDWLCRWLDCHSWIDHVGSAVFEGHRVFVSQPYGDAVDFDPREVDIFCRVLDLEYRIDERSDWWPGETFSILIFAPTSSNAEAGQ